MIKFNQHDIPKLPFKKAVKKPIPIKCIQLNEAFVVKTLEGIMQGKKGDWLMVGVQGELYPCDNDIFKKTYELLENND